MPAPAGRCRAPPRTGQRPTPAAHRSGPHGPGGTWPAPRSGSRGDCYRHLYLATERQEAAALIGHGVQPEPRMVPRRSPAAALLATVAEGLVRIECCRTVVIHSCRTILI